MGNSDRDERRRKQVEARRAARRPSAIEARKKRNNLLTMIGVAAVAVIVIGGVVILLSGGDDEPPAEPSREVAIEGDEYSFAPDPALGLAGEIAITLDNIGQIGHELVVLDQGVRITAADQFDESTELARIDSIAAGTQASTSVDLAAGTYQVVCLLAGHLESGMESDLVVT